jgi:hypothetical protein
MTISFPEQFNMASYFLDDRIKEGKGDKIAVYYEDQQYTYADVQKMANRVGLISDSESGISHWRNVQSYTLVLGRIYLSGCALSPLNSSTGRLRLSATQCVRNEGFLKWSPTS